MSRNVARFTLMAALAATSLTLPLTAQQQGGFLGIGGHDDKPHFNPPLPYKIFHLSSMTQQNDATEVLNAVRRVINSESVTLMGIQNDLLVIGSPEQLKAAEDLIKALDQPRPLYHVMFTVTETTGTQRTVRHYAVQATGGQDTNIKATRWIQLTPPPTPVNEKGQPVATPKVEHIETGLTIDIVLDEYQGGVRMHSRLANTSISADPAPAGTQAPVLEQQELDNVSLLLWNKPIVLGVIDPPGTGTHIEIEVQAEQRAP